MKYLGKRILVLCGGPSVNNDIKEVSDYDICISANQHGMKVKECDFIVSMDEYHQQKNIHMREFLEDLKPKKISIRFWSDYRISGISKNAYMNSGTMAVYVACLLGGNPVIVTGIDGYQNGTYFHNINEDCPGLRYPYINYCLMFQYLKNLCTGYNVRPISGPLLEYFKKYDPNEKFHPIEVPDSGYAKSTYKVLTQRNITIWQTVVPKGMEIWVTSEELRLNPNTFRVIN